MTSGLFFNCYHLEVAGCERFVERYHLARSGLPACMHRCMRITPHNVLHIRLLLLEDFHFSVPRDIILLHVTRMPTAEGCVVKQFRGGNLTIHQQDGSSERVVLAPRMYFTL